MTHPAWIAARRVSVSEDPRHAPHYNFPTDIAFGADDTTYILCRTEGVALIRIWPLDDIARGRRIT